MSNTSELELTPGRRIYLQELRQYFTYEGLWEGLPTAERNKKKLEWLITDHRDKPYPGSPYLITPSETPIEYQEDKRYPFGTPSALPAVTCIGRFTSFPIRPESGDYSGLVVIWFQDGFAFPIDPTVVSQLQAIDWERQATDVIY